jgi:hypothetical protein
MKMTNQADGICTRDVKTEMPVLTGVAELPEDLSRESWDLLKDNSTANIGPIGCRTTGASEMENQFIVIGLTDIPKHREQLTSALLEIKTGLDESKEEQSISRLRRFMAENLEHLNSNQQRKQMFNELHEQQHTHSQNQPKYRGFVKFGPID